MHNRKHHSEHSSALEHDYLTAAAIKLIKFFGANKKIILVCAAVAAVVLGGWFIYAGRQASVLENSWKALATAIISEDNNAFDEVAQKFPGTDAALYARYYKADALYSAQSYKESAEIFKEISSAANKELAAVSLLSAAAAYQAAGDYENAVKSADNFISAYPGNFALPQAYLTLALSQELAGKKAEAVESYKVISARFPQGYFGAFAAAKLKEAAK